MVQLDTFITTLVGIAILIYVGFCMYRGGIHIRTMVDGKRPWKRELKVRYDALVGNTSPQNTFHSGEIRRIETPVSRPKQGQWWSCGDSNPVPLQCH